MQVEEKTVEMGRSRDRADARLKVTGGAQYSADFAAPRMAYAVFVGSTIAKGRVGEIDTTAAEAAGGVIQVLTCQNAMRVNRPADFFDPTKKQPPKPNEVTTNTATRVLRFNPKRSIAGARSLPPSSPSRSSRRRRRPIWWR